MGLKHVKYVPLAAGIVLAMSTVVVAQDGGGSGHGDLFGDLVQIKRDAGTGQPILQKRQIGESQDTLVWGYCVIPVDEHGQEIPFLPLSCDVDPAFASRLVPIDYFGRLSSGRTKERNLRMHFDEAIDNIKSADVVDLDQAGRLRLGTDCQPNDTCATWKVIDSPLENLAMYHRILKYGHIQTDPMEEDLSAHGDPAAGTVYHTALAPEDYAKFRGAATSLLPFPTASECFTGTSFTATCALPQRLTATDFHRVASMLAGAADKTGRITVDLVQYLNRMLHITVATPESVATLDTLPALIRDENGVIAPATDGLAAPADERFVDYSRAGYLRVDHFSRLLTALVAADAGLWRTESNVSLLPFLDYRNGPMTSPVTGMTGFVQNANDGLRAVEFIHNYEVPADLWALSATTTTTAAPQTTMYSAVEWSVRLEAQVTSRATVSVGTVLFTVQTNEGVVVGTPTTSGKVTNGIASAEYKLPGGTEPQTLVLIAAYADAAQFAASSGNSTLTITPAETATVVAAGAAPPAVAEQQVQLAAAVTAINASPINEGVLTFTVRDAGGAIIGVPQTASVINNAAVASYTVPAGLRDQVLTVSGSFGGTAHFLASLGTGALTIGCPGAVISPAMPVYAVLGQLYNQTFTFGTAPATMVATGTLPPGLAITGQVLTGTPTLEGEFSFTLSAVDAIGCTASRAYTIYVGTPRSFVTGSGPGAVARVRTFAADGTPQTGLSADFLAYDSSFLGGARVALADVTMDGVPDTITGAGPGGAAHVTVVNGANGVAVRSFLAFPDAPADGVYVAGGDVDNDGIADIIVGRASGTPQVRVFSGRTGETIRDFVVENLGSAGVHVASIDVNADGFSDIIVGSGPGVAPAVKVLEGAGGTVLASIQPYVAEFLGGVFVAGGDVDGDGFGDIITGAGAGGGPHVRVWSGGNGREILGFYAFDPSFTGGVRVAASDLNRDGHAEIIAAAGPGGAPRVRVFDGVAAAAIADFEAYDASFTGGVFVAGAAPQSRMVVDLPAVNSTVGTTFLVAGWAFEESALFGSGVDAIDVWAVPVNGGAPTFVGSPSLGQTRPDVAEIYGERWEYSGFSLLGELPPGDYDLIVFVHSSVTGTFNNRRVVRISVR